MRNYLDDRNYIFNLLINLRQNYGFLKNLRGRRQHAGIIDDCICIEKEKLEQIVVSVSNEDRISVVELWIRKYKEYYHLLKDWKIKQDDKTIVIEWNNSQFFFDLDEIELASAII